MEKIDTYNRESYLKDLENLEMPHIKNRKHFINFYTELGNDPAQYAQDWNNSVFRILGFEPQGSIIDLGCHWGYSLIHFARLGHECVGIEISRPLIEYGLQQLAKEPIEVQQKVLIFEGMIEDFVCDRKFDSVILSETLEHVIDPLLVLKKASELVTPDGVVYISTPAIRKGTYSHVRGINKEEMQSLLKAAGFTRVAWIDYWQKDQHTVCMAKL